ncbi:MAG: alpha/beta fold hydrolase [Ectothiorhodospiraceae bacterium]|jgi:pimeloyl-ACP methyl ester carboxylesterase/predicted glycosyltransferase
MADRSVELAGSPRFVERDGCRVGYRVAGEGETTLLLFSAWQIVHSGVWKAQVPYLAQFCRVIAIDCRGNGLSGRPDSTAAYLPWELVADAVAVLEAEGVDRPAIVAGFSYGGHLAALFAAYHPHRTRAAILLAPTAPFGPGNPAFTAANLKAERDTYEGWQKYNFHYWRRNYRDFADFFVREVFPEPFSDKQVEDALDWAAETDPETLVRTIAARRDSDGQGEEAYRRIQCPVLVIQGTDDTVVPHAKGERVAALTNARFVSLPGSGHMPSARIPVKVNRLMRSFIDDVTGGLPSTRSTAPFIAPRGVNRRAKALYLSSPIGLGHVRRDRAIADALRERRPDIDIDWLTQPPVTGFLKAAGEHVHPGSNRLLSESRHIESESGEHDLNAFQALRRMDAILVANFCTFQDVLEDGGYDLVIADEAWDIDRFWHEHPELKRARLAWMTDFVGVLPMTGRDSDESRLARDWNAEMIGFVESRPDVRDAALFIGDREDVVDLPFGPGLPSIRDWTAAHHAFPGYIDSTEQLPAVDRARLRAAMGFHADEVVCLVAVGGSGVGRTLVQRLLEVVPQLRARMPALTFEVVTGPRIDPATLPRVDGVKYRAFVPDFLDHVRCCDVAIVQGGLSTAMELTCLGKPFLYVPLEHHFEQQIHVHHRLQRYGLGRRVTFAELIDADRLAQQLQGLLTKHAEGACNSRPAGGAAARAAETLSGLL